MKEEFRLVGGGGGLVIKKLQGKSLGTHKTSRGLGKKRKGEDKWNQPLIECKGVKG